MAAACVYMLNLYPVLDGVVVRQIDAHPPAPTVIFVVMDTVRADHTSLCGYERPTTPTLSRLVDQGASASCQARTPGAWTVPSHASYFTGVPVPEHRADAVRLASSDGARPGWRTQGLGPDLPTLAEQLQARGYQTRLISGNSLLNADLGLSRGFQSTSIASPAEQIVKMLDDLSADRPLFLFVNLFEAHEPRPPPPVGLRWAPTRWRGSMRPLNPSSAWARYVDGQMPAEEAEQYLARVTDGYDYGVWRADAALDRVLWALEASGWLSAGYRLAITSDHGELLGEHGLLEHGCYLWEALTRVPLLVYSSEGTPPVPPGPISATEVHHFVLEGRFQSTRLPVQAYGLPVWWRQAFDDRVGASRNAAIWRDDQKLLWTDGRLARYNLRDDPDELHPLPLEDPDDAAALRQAGAALDVFLGGGPLAPEVVEALRAAGYLE